MGEHLWKWGNIWEIRAFFSVALKVNVLAGFCVCQLRLGNKSGQRIPIPTAQQAKRWILDPAASLVLGHSHKVIEFPEGSLGVDEFPQVKLFPHNNFSQAASQTRPRPYKDMGSVDLTLVHRWPNSLR